MKKKKVIIIVIVILFSISLIHVGINLLNNKNNKLNEDDYVAEDYIFQDPDDVVIVSNDGEKCEIKAVTKDGEVFIYMI